MFSSDEPTNASPRSVPSTSSRPDPTTADVRSASSTERSSFPVKPRTDPTPHLSVLERRRQPRDTLDPKFLSGPFGAEVRDPSSARYVGAFEGSDYYLAPARHRRLCIFDRDSETSTAGGNCADRSSPSRGFWLGSLTADGNRKVVVVVPDRYTKVVIVGSRPLQQSPVRNNTLYLLLRPTRRTRVVVSGPSRSPITLVLPALTPDGRGGKNEIIRE